MAATDQDRADVRKAVKYIRQHDCDFLTADTVGMYAHVSEEIAREVMLADDFSPKLVA